MPTEEISAEKIISKYDDGMSLPNITKHFKTNRSTILRFLIEDGGEKGKTIALIYLDSSKSRKVKIREVVERYKDGLSIEQIADEYDVDDVTVVNRLKDYENIFGINIIKRRGRPRRADLDLAANDIVEEYKEGTVLAEIAGAHQCCAVAIRSRLDEHIEKTGEDIDKIHDKSIRQKGQSNGETEEEESEPAPVLKVASLESICSIIEKYGYPFEELSHEAEKRGYIVLRETYIKAFEIVKRQKAKETEGKEVEW